MFSKFAWFLLLVGICCPVLGQDKSSPESRQAQDARIEQLIKKLGADAFKDREEATSELMEIGSAARKALDQAALNPDLEIASRAKKIIAQLPKYTHSLVDALGAPIPSAKVTVQFFRRLMPGEFTEVEAAPSLSSTTDEQGGVAIPSMIEGNVRVVVTMQHDNYGRARNELHPDQKITTIQMPLVPKGSEAHSRALIGQVTQVEGQRIFDALIHCENVRTPGAGLINGRFPIGEALTDNDGFFAFYLPSTNEGKQRGELIPQNSRYSIRVSAPAADSRFPMAGSYPNTGINVLRMVQATRQFRFQFEAADGGNVEDQTQLQQARIQCEQTHEGELNLVSLDPSAAVKGYKLIEGKYLAQMFTNSGVISYLPLTVTADSPEVLRFRLPPTITYRGRILHGVTGKPMKNAFLMGWKSTARNNLALLNSDEWKALQDTTANPELSDPAVRRLGELYGVQRLVRTDSEGRFELLRKPNEDLYGLMAFDQDFVPFKVTVGALKPDEKHVVDIGDLPLFPAAKLLVQPIFEGPRLSVSPEWVYSDKDQPEWFEKFRTAQKGSDRQFEYVHWLTINEAQPIYIPADIPLRVRFESPYDDKWTAKNIDTVFNLKQGELQKFGELRFLASLPITVRVVGKDGAPIEGLPVRKKLSASDGWSIVHNTDKNGEALFHVPPGSTGQLRVSDLPGDPEGNKAANLFTDFAIKEEALPQPLVITVTPEQVELLKGAKK